jgi:hypothetical protein
MQLSARFGNALLHGLPCAMSATRAKSAAPRDVVTNKGRNMTQTHCRFAIAGVLLITGQAQALAQDEIDRIRDQVAAAERDTQIGAGYAQLIGFITDPDVSGITLTDHDEPETKLDIFKLPLQFRISEYAGWRFFVRGGINYATYTFDDLLAGQPSSQNIDAEYKAISGSLGAVAKRPLSPSWSLALAADAGLARFENDAKYRGATEMLAPVLDELFFNWSTDASLFSGVAGLEYRNQIETIKVAGNFHYIHTLVSSFGESGDFQGFREHTDTLHVDVDIEHPWNTEVSGYPLAGVVHIGNTTFVGSNRDALGFSTLWSLGYALQLDVSKREWPVQSAKLGFNYLVGDDDVEGYEIVLGYRF